MKLIWSVSNDKLLGSGHSSHVAVGEYARKIDGIDQVAIATECSSQVVGMEMRENAEMID